MKYQFIATHASDSPVKQLCAALGVSTSGYYAWRKRPQSQHNREDGVLKTVIESVYRSNWGCYGSPRIYVELQAQSYSCSRKRVARLMREQGLCARSIRRRVHTTRQEPAHQKTENVLNREFEASAPNQKWVADVRHVGANEIPG